MYAEFLTRNTRMVSIYWLESEIVFDIGSVPRKQTLMQDTKIGRLICLIFNLMITSADGNWNNSNLWQAEALNTQLLEV